MFSSVAWRASGRLRRTPDITVHFVSLGFTYLFELSFYFHEWSISAVEFKVRDVIVGGGRDGEGYIRVRCTCTYVHVEIEASRS